MKKYLVLSAIVCATAAPAWAGYINNFTDFYYIADGSNGSGPTAGTPLGNWTVVADAGTSWLALGGLDGSLAVRLSGNGTIRLYTTAPAAGQVDFSYIWDTGIAGGNDAGTGDRATFVASGLTQQIGGDADTVGNGSASLTDVPDRVFGWEVSSDGVGANILTIGSFRAPGPVAIPDLANTALLLASSLGGLVALRRRLS